MNNLTNKSDAELRELLQQSRQLLAALAERFTDRPDMQNAIRRLMRPDDMLETFSELAVKEPDLMRLVLQASVAALVNVQSVGDGKRKQKFKRLMDFKLSNKCKVAVRSIILKMKQNQKCLPEFQRLAEIVLT